MNLTQHVETVEDFDIAVRLARRRRLNWAFMPLGMGVIAALLVYLAWFISWWDQPAPGATELLLMWQEWEDFRQTIRNVLPHASVVILAVLAIHSITGGQGPPDDVESAVDAEMGQDLVVLSSMALALASWLSMPIFSSKEHQWEDWLGVLTLVLAGAISVSARSTRLRREQTIRRLTRTIEAGRARKEEIEQDLRTTRRKHIFRNFIFSDWVNAWPREEPSHDELTGLLTGTPLSRQKTWWIIFAPHVAPTMVLLGLLALGRVVSIQAGGLEVLGLWVITVCLSVVASGGVLYLLQMESRESRESGGRGKFTKHLLNLMQSSFFVILAIMIATLYVPLNIFHYSVSIAYVIYLISLPWIFKRVFESHYLILALRYHENNIKNGERRLRLLEEALLFGAPPR